MKAELTITPSTNIYAEAKHIIDPALVQKILLNWEDIFTVQDVRRKVECAVSISKISLYDHLIIIDDVPYKILHMFSASDSYFASRNQPEPK